MSFVVRFSTLSYFLCFTNRSMATSTDFCIRLEITCTQQPEATVQYAVGQQSSPLT